MNLPASTTNAAGLRLFPIPDAGRGLATVTRTSDGAVISAFCPAPANGSGQAVVWHDFTFFARRPEFTSDAATPTTYYTTVTDNDWGHGAVSDVPLLETDSGSGRFKYVAGVGSAGVIGLHDSQVIVRQTLMRASFYIEPTGKISIFYTVPGASFASAISTDLVATDGYYYCLSRTNTRFYMQASADGITYVNIFPYPVQYNTGGTMWWVFDVFGDSAYHLVKPEYGYA